MVTLLQGKKCNHTFHVVVHRFAYIIIIVCHSACN